MCLTVIAYRSIPDIELLLLSNRDEFLDRPTAPLHRWPDRPQIVGGRDERAGGSWLAVSDDGRLANVTNVREDRSSSVAAPSRGLTVVQFLVGDESAMTFGHRAVKASEHNGFNLLLWDGENLVFASNRAPDVVSLAPGLYAFSNGRWDSEWPKVVRAREALRRLIETHSVDIETLLGLLLDGTRPPDDDLPVTGVGLDWERTLSSAFIRSPNYGTRSSTIVKWMSDGTVRLDEFTHQPRGRSRTLRSETLRATSARIRRL